MYQTWIRLWLHRTKRAKVKYFFHCMFKIKTSSKKPLLVLSYFCTKIDPWFLIFLAAVSRLEFITKSYQSFGNAWRVSLSLDPEETPESSFGSRAERFKKLWCRTSTHENPTSGVKWNAPLYFSRYQSDFGLFTGVIDGCPSDKNSASGPMKVRHAQRKSRPGFRFLRNHEIAALSSVKLLRIPNYFLMYIEQCIDKMKQRNCFKYRVIYRKKNIATCSSGPRDISFRSKNMMCFVLKVLIGSARYCPHVDFCQLHILSLITTHQTKLGACFYLSAHIDISSSF